MPAKIDLIKRVVRNMQAMVVESNIGVATNNTLVDANLFFQNNEQLKGKYLYAYGTPTYSAFHRLITNYGGTPTVQVAPSWGTSAAPTLNQSYFIMDGYRIEDLKDLAEQAIKAAGKHYFPRTYATFQVVATQYEYTIPSGMAFISELHFVASGSTEHSELDQFAIPRKVWSVGNSKIVFNPEVIDLDTYDDNYIQMIGQSRPPLLANDHSTYDDILEEYLVAYCERELSKRRIGEGQEWLAKYNAARQKLAEEIDNISFGIDADSVKVD